MDGAASPRVLVIGLDPYRVPGPWDPEPVAKAIEGGLTKFAEHGVGVETCLIGLDGRDDVEAAVGNALRAHPWECVTVGGGLRHSDDHVELLEQVINLVRRHAPDAAIAFDSTPATTLRGRCPVDRVTAANGALGVTLRRWTAGSRP
ncbi:hypothetical protein SRB17_20040 [Streptomyces sp. RB17]|uniref:hypothetical protein n=1 Tax=Streptomyces sp. RB17 TaxID=2585197 RepID=UPI00130A7802|nr:hypothetical protein [Streptomyces sp. RB17]MQY34038.1 hypothetical protein [Streptomyces sp. RB17]